MRSFKDTIGRDWTITVTLDSVRRVRADCKFDLSDVTAANFIRLGSDSMLLGDVLWSLIKPQAEQRGLSATQFFEALSGDCLFAATDALTEGVIDFFDSRRGSALRRLKQKTDEAAKIILQRAEAQVETITAEQLATAAAEAANGNRISTPTSSAGN